MSTTTARGYRNRLFFEAVTKLLLAFALGWFACIAIGGFRNYVNRTPVEVFREDGTRLR